MRILALLMLVAAPAAAQVAPSIPAGNPLDPGAAAAGQAVSRLQRQAEAAARAEAIAAMEPVRPATAPDEGRTRAAGTSFGQSIGTPIGQPTTGQPASPGGSPYMRLGGIRTPWDPR